jgi:hypothetical protein
MRSDRLLRVALEAEILRQRRRVRRVVIRAVLAAVAAVFLFGALCWFEVATYFWVHLNLGWISSTLIVVAGNLLTALLLLLVGSLVWGRPDRIEREALEVRARAQQQLDSIVTFTTTFLGPAGRLLRRSRALGLAAAILLPRFLVRRRR